ncbi:hypothetical protein DF268_42140 [Streptomyces sp. V2]|uniref:Uncharacterized protein n=1 Tax=Streptomyces niveiscabiei TaxID=164115 RepID=A0ABW9HTN9_9ACTN|nr:MULTISPECIES: hypothetical protein [Streptomyces]PWG07647.1 hypothetical protein DF268_42140 [Streptomyces sp. V2]QZZ28943.1 hypothetical protein A7X85_24195 [Streptomyces sp. ST1015]
MNKKQRRQILAEVYAERERLLPLRGQASRTTIEMVRSSAGNVGEPEMVPYLNLAYLLGVKRGLGEDALMAFALSLANWAVAAVAEVARSSGRTVEQVVDMYETAIMAAGEALEEEEKVPLKEGFQHEDGFWDED